MGRTSILGLVGLLVIGAGVLALTLTSDSDEPEQTSTEQQQVDEPTPPAEANGEPEQPVRTTEDRFTIELADGWSKVSTERSGLYRYEKGTAYVEFDFEPVGRGVSVDLDWRYAVDSDGGVSLQNPARVLCEPSNAFCAAGDGELQVFAKEQGDGDGSSPFVLLAGDTSAEDPDSAVVGELIEVIDSLILL